MWTSTENLVSDVVTWGLAPVDDPGVLFAHCLPLPHAEATGQGARGTSPVFEAVPANVGRTNGRSETTQVERSTS